MDGALVFAVPLFEVFAFLVGLPSALSRGRFDADIVELSVGKSSLSTRFTRLASGGNFFSGVKFQSNPARLPRWRSALAYLS